MILKKDMLYITARFKGGRRSQSGYKLLAELGFNTGFICGGALGCFDN